MLKFRLYISGEIFTSSAFSGGFEPRGRCGQDSQGYAWSIDMMILAYAASCSLWGQKMIDKALFQLGLYGARMMRMD